MADDKVGAFGVAAIGFLCLAVVAGGASASPTSAGMVRVAAVPLLAVAIYRFWDWRVSSKAIWPTAILVLAFSLLFAQRIPLPPEIWTRLPGRALAVEAYRAAGLALPDLPISLTPEGTWDAILGLLPPTAMFLAALTLGTRARWLCAVAVVLLAVASTSLGMLQLAGGPDSPLRFYAITNNDAAVGFFANRNHQAALLVAAVPFAAVIATTWRGGADVRNSFRTMAVVAALLVLVVAIGVTRSRAGVLLLAPAFIAGLFIAMRGRLARQGRGPDWTAITTLAGSGIAGVALVAAFSLSPLAERFQTLRDETRLQLTATTIHAGRDYAPFGSGAGSFQVIYKSRETPEMVTNAYANHAHNDYAEIWLETGWAGMALVACFIIWWVASLSRTLREEADRGSALSLAGATVIGLLLAHSAADYPLRTPALATIFALSCALMAPSGQRRERPPMSARGIQASA